MLNLPVPFTDEDLLGEIEKTGARFYEGEHGDGMEMYIRVVLTRGVGSIGYDIESCPSPTLVIIVKPQVNPPAETYEQGVSLVIVPVVRNHPSSVTPIIKSNNLLNNALAWQSAYGRGAYDALMRNYRGEISECATSNVFAVKHGTVRTPPIEDGLLPGITRWFVFECGKSAGVPVVETTLHDEDVFGADELFITGTTREIVPVVKVDDRTVGAGKPGETTWRLLREFRRRVAEEYYGGRPGGESPSTEGRRTGDWEGAEI
jgi:branched-chain amino acid aminotransferase